MLLKNSCPYFSVSFYHFIYFSCFLLQEAHHTEIERLEERLVSQASDAQIELTTRLNAAKRVC